MVIAGSSATQHLLSTWRFREILGHSQVPSPPFHLFKLPPFAASTCVPLTWQLQHSSEPLSHSWPASCRLWPLGRVPLKTTELQLALVPWPLLEPRVPGQNSRHRRRPRCSPLPLGAPAEGSAPSPCGLYCVWVWKRGANDCRQGK